MPLLKKINSAWKPSENLGLQVGETIEITAAKQLIIGKMAVAVDDEGNELDAFELYGVIDQDLIDEVKAFKAEKKAKEEESALQKENEKMKAELAKLKKSDAKQYKAAEIKGLKWQELRAEAKKAGVLDPKLDRDALEAVLLAI